MSFNQRLKSRPVQSAIFFRSTFMWTEAHTIASVESAALRQAAPPHSVQFTLNCFVLGFKWNTRVQIMSWKKHLYVLKNKLLSSFVNLKKYFPDLF